MGDSVSLAVGWGVWNTAGSGVGLGVGRSGGRSVGRISFGSFIENTLDSKLFRKVFSWC